MMASLAVFQSVSLPSAMSLPQRPASTQWEPLVIPDLPGCQVWGWFQPPHAPNTVTILVPQAVSQQFGMYLTARRLFASAGWPIESAASWSVFGTVLDVMQGANPALDQPIPFPPGQDVEVSLVAAQTPPSAAVASGPAGNTQVEPPPETAAKAESAPQGVIEGLDDILAAAEPVQQTAPQDTSTAPPPVAPSTAPPQHAAPAFPQQQPPVASPVPVASAQPSVTPPVGGQPAVAGPEADGIFASIEADWRAIEQIERQLAALTKQLNGQAAKLQSLNRDLAPQERLAADGNDIKDWNDVRRMLRDASANISKQVRAFDIGTVSAAGNRNRFHDIFTQYVQTRTPFDGMQQIANEFEQHRQICQSLMTKSGSALSGAQRDAEGKARTVLNRIRAKQRKK